MCTANLRRRGLIRVDEPRRRHSPLSVGREHAQSSSPNGVSVRRLKSAAAAGGFRLFVNENIQYTLYAHANAAFGRGGGGPGRCAFAARDRGAAAVHGAWARCLFASSAGPVQNMIEAILFFWGRKNDIVIFMDNRESTDFEIYRLLFYETLIPRVTRCSRCRDIFFSDCLSVVI